MRIVITALAALVLGGSVAAPAAATAQAGAETKVSYGLATPGAKGIIKVGVRSAAFGTAGGFTAYWLRSVLPVENLKLSYGTSVDYRRITTACILKETEGQVAVDGLRLGKTRCTAGDLSDTLKRGPVPVRVVYNARTGAVSQVREMLTFVERPKLISSYALVKNFTADSLTIQSFTTKNPGKGTFTSLKKPVGTMIKIGYTSGVTFYRTSAKCSGDGGLLGDSSKADDKGLGTKACTTRDMYAALKKIMRMGGDTFMSVKVVYDPAGLKAVKVYEAFPCQGEDC